jgi:hypothetical protein
MTPLNILFSKAVMKKDTLQKLIFIYNADSGLRNLLLDGAHKILSPSTYACSLCDITFGAFTENTVWKKFRLQLADTVQMEFLHKDEFTKAYRSKFGYKFTFPIVLMETTTDLEIFVQTEELNQLEDATALIALLKARL